MSSLTYDRMNLHINTHTDCSAAGHTLIKYKIFWCRKKILPKITKGKKLKRNTSI